MKVAILHQGCIPIYRRPFYERIGAGYTVFHGQSLEGIATARPPFSFDNVIVENRRIGRFIYQPVFWKIVTGKFDAIVVGHEVKYLVNLALAVYFRLRGKPVILWGFGRNVRGPAWLQYLMLCLATDYLAYTAGSAEQVGMALDRVTVLNNTFDLEPEIKAHAEALLHNRDAIRKELSLSPTDIVFVFVGRPIPEKGIDVLEDAVLDLRREGLPVDARVVTNVYDRDRLARIFRACDALVIPGYVGLAVNHAFAHGLPVITVKSPYHSPEVEYIREGINGMIVDDLKEALREFATSPALRQGLAQGALDSRDRLDLQHMIDAFNRGVNQAVSRSHSPKSIVHLLLNLTIGVPLTIAIVLFLQGQRWITALRRRFGRWRSYRVIVIPDRRREDK